MNAQLIDHIGWTLIQFLWQGTLLSILFAVVRGLFGRSITARVRYRLACATLSAMAFAPLATFFATRGSTAAPVIVLPSPDALQSALPWLVAAWFSGVIVFSVRLIAGWRITARLRSDGVRPAPAEWQETLDALIHRIGVSRPVQLLVSSLVEVPTVVGWLRPVVLVPVGALTGLPPAHVQALLAHELAHICRADYLVNILQSIAEAVLFYHPAVWWVSDQIRTERELCCDDLAVAASGDVLTYARALADLESCRPSRTHVLAANGGSLLNRIRRLIGQPISYALPGPGAAGAMSLLWLVGLGAVAAHGAPPPPPPPPFPIEQAPAPPLLALNQHPILSTLLFSPYGPSPAPQAPKAAAPAEAATIRIEGRVISAAGTPIPRPRVELFGPEGGKSKTGDDNGRFVFDNLAAGDYMLQGTKAGFVTGGYGAPAPGAPPLPISVEAGSTVKDAVIKLTPQGVVSGHVTNEDGDVVPWVPVTAYRTTYVLGRKQLERAGSATTDDEGYYRIASLPPGRYYLGVLSAEPASQGAPPPPPPPPPPPANDDGPAAAEDEQFGGVISFNKGGFFKAIFADERFGDEPETALAEANEKGLADVATFYPNGLDLSGASPLAIAPGSRLERIDIRLRRERVYSIKGVVSQNGTPVLDSSVVVKRRDGNVTLQRTSAAVQKGGGFEVANLPAGSYTVQAFVGDPPNISGRIEVSVGNANVDGVVVPVEPGIALTGAFRGEDGDLKSLSKFAAELHPQLQLIPEDTAGGNSPARGKQDGTFRGRAVPAGRYLLEITDLPASIYVKSIRYSGQDVTRAPLDLTANGGSLEIVLAPKAAKVSGLLRDEKGAPLAGVTVMIWPKTLNLGSPTRGAQTVATDRNGKFQADGLAPGDYYAAGWEGESLSSGVLQIPELLARFAGEAIVLKLAESAQANVEVKMIPASKIAAEVAKLP